MNDTYMKSAEPLLIILKNSCELKKIIKKLNEKIDSLGEQHKLLDSRTEAILETLDF